MESQPIERLLPLMGKLALIQLSIEPILLQKRIMGALLYDMPIPHNQDHIRLPDSGQTVGYNEGGSALHHGVKGFLNLDFCSGIDRGGRFVQKQHRRQTQHHPRNT